MLEKMPIFQKIKSYIINQIELGVWKEGDLISSEAMLTKMFNASRMTVNRALRELSTEQILMRRQGVGTFVAIQKFQSTLLEIKNIADEITARGQKHHSELHRLEVIKANEWQALQFQIKAGDRLFHSLIVHFENTTPIQVEERWVNPKIAPNYITQDFDLITPNAYLMNVAPLQSMAYKLEAIPPTEAIAKMLRIDKTQPCLVLHRTTHSNNQAATSAIMWHPGDRYHFISG